MRFSYLHSASVLFLLAGNINAGECWISNLPGNFEIQYLMPSGSTTETAVFTWRSYQSAPGLTKTCLAITGSDAIFSMNSTNPHFKSALDQLRFAKANGFPVSIQATDVWDANYGYPISIVIAK